MICDTPIHFKVQIINLLSYINQVTKNFPYPNFQSPTLFNYSSFYENAYQQTLR